MLLKKPMGQWRNQRKIRKYLKENENENNFPKSMGFRKSISKREVYSNTDLPQERRKISHKQSNLPPKGITKRRTNKAQSQQKEGNDKDQSGNK